MGRNMNVVIVMQGTGNITALIPNVEKKFHSSMGFRYHKEVHQPKLHCGICNKFFTYKITLKKHLEYSHGFGDVKKHMCPDANCNETTWDKTKCLKHLQKHNELSP
ncbi:hypothetical protein LOAG_15919, partial [Loa loa]